MDRVNSSAIRRKIARTLGCVTVALFLAAAAFQPNPALAAPHGGGGFHGGGSHGGGFHAGGFHAGAFHGGAFHAGGFHAGGVHGSFATPHNGFADERVGHWNHGWHRGGYAWWGPGVAVTVPLWWDYSYPEYGYYDYGVPYAGQYWYYCSDPAGYYPYVAQCYSGWQAVPAG